MGSFGNKTLFTCLKLISETSGKTADLKIISTSNHLQEWVGNYFATFVMINYEKDKQNHQRKITLILKLYIQSFPVDERRSCPAKNRQTR